MSPNLKAPSQRQLRVGEEIRHNVADIFLNESFHGTPLQGISITVSEVRVSPDLRNATIFVMPLGGNTPEGFMETLEGFRPQLRYRLGRKVKLRYIPQLSFRFDNSFEYASRIESLLAPT